MLQAHFLFMLLNQLSLVFCVSDCFYQNVIPHNFPYYILPCWFCLFLHSIRITLPSGCYPISFYHILEEKSGFYIYILVQKLLISFIPGFIVALGNVSTPWSYSLGKYFTFDKHYCSFAVPSWCVGGVLHSGFYNRASSDL